MNSKSGITELSIHIAKLPGRKFLPIYIFNGGLAYHIIIYLPLLLTLLFLNSSVIFSYTNAHIVFTMCQELSSISCIQDS